MPTARSLIRHYQAHPDPARALDVLRELSQMPLSARDLLSYHEALLFGKAYPGSAAIYGFCARELRRFAARVTGLEDGEREELDQSGVAETRIFYPYDYETACWLSRCLKETIEIDWDAYDERDDDPLADLLPLLMSRTESDLLDDDRCTTRQVIEAARGTMHKTSLEWILDGLARALPDGIRQTLYNKMQLMLSLTLTSKGPSRTLLDDGKPADLFIWDAGDARRKFDLIAEIKRPLDIPPPVSPKRGRELLDLAFGTLLPRLRELYPATHGNPAEVYDIPLERGIRVIVWFMRPEFRLPLEVGWGLLLLKNHVPIGYGAGGMLADRSEIAINVFDTFRGGEAAWLYSQYARIFNAFCGAPWLVTRKFQIGYENEEGIASGAYWFWDKLGFRSADKEIRRLADRERKQIAKGKGYRSSRRILKQLCQADIVLSLNGEPPENYQEYPLGQAGLTAAKVLADQFGGNRRGFEKQVVGVLKERFGMPPADLSPAELSALGQMGLWLLAIPDFDRWPTRDREPALELCRLKGAAREADYAQAMRKNLCFFEALKTIRNE